MERDETLLKTLCLGRGQIYVALLQLSVKTLPKRAKAASIAANYGFVSEELILPMALVTASLTIVA